MKLWFHSDSVLDEQTDAQHARIALARAGFGTEQSFDKEKMHKRFAYATTDNLHSVLDKLNNQIILEIRDAASRTQTWGRTIGHLEDDPAVDDDFVSLIEDWAS